jgi:hypothetical protein
MAFLVFRGDAPSGIFCCAVLESLFYRALLGSGGCTLALNLGDGKRCPANGRCGTLSAGSFDSLRSPLRGSLRLSVSLVPRSALALADIAPPLARCNSMGGRWACGLHLAARASPHRAGLQPRPTLCWRRSSRPPLPALPPSPFGLRRTSRAASRSFLARIAAAWVGVGMPASAFGGEFFWDAHPRLRLDQSIFRYWMKGVSFVGNGLTGRLIRSRFTATHPSGFASLRPKGLQAFGLFAAVGG